MFVAPKVYVPVGCRDIELYHGPAAISGHAPVCVVSDVDQVDKVPFGHAAGAIAFTTDKGRAAWEFMRDSRTELRKVVWPTRKETTQTTLVVIGVVTLVAIFLWMVDGVLSWIVRLVLGHGG